MRSRILIFIALCRLLHAQDNPIAALDAGERALTSGNFVLAGQQMDRALSSAGNVVLPSPDLRRVVLRSMEVAVLNAQFAKAEKLTAEFPQIGGLEPEQIVRMRIVMASCAIARGNLAAASEAANSAVVLARQQLDATNDWAINALAELAEVRNLEGNFVESRQLATAIAKASEGRADSPNLSFSALAIPSEAAFTEGRLADARTFAEAVKSARPLPVHPTSLMLRELLARIAIEEGRVSDAAGLMDGVSDGARRQLGPNHPFVIQSLLTEAAILSCRNAWQEAEARLANASALLDAAPAANLKFRLMELRVAVMLGTHRADDAATVLGQAAQLAPSGGAGSQAMATVANLRGAIATEQRKFEDAEKSLREAASILSGQAGERQPVRMANLFYTGLLYDRWGDSERAQLPLTKWIDLRGAAAADEPEAVALSILGRNALRQKQSDLATTFISRSIAIRNDIAGLSLGELGQEYNSLGIALRESGKLDNAIAAFLRAKDLRSPGEKYEPDLDVSLSESLLGAGRATEALPYLENRLQLISKGGLSTNEALGLADQVSRLQITAGRFQDAEHLLRQLYDAGIAGRGPGAKDRFALLERLGDAEEHLNHYEEASDYLGEMAHMRLLTKKWPEAEQLARRAEAIAQKAPASSPSLASAMNVLAETRLAQGAPDDAGSLYVQAIDATGATQRTRAISLNGQGEIALANKQWEQAGELLNEALKAAADSDLVGSGVEAVIVANLASAQKSEGHEDNANELYSRFLTLEPKSHPPQDPPLLNQLNELAAFYSLQTGRAGDVLDVYNRGLRSSQLVFGERSDEFAVALYDLAEFQRNRKNLDEAIPLYERSSKLYEELYGLQSDQVLNVRSSMAAAYRSAGKTSDAIRLIEPLIHTPNKSNLFQVNLLEQLGALYIEAGNNAAAVASYQDLVDIFENQSPAYLNSKWRGAMEGLINATLSQGHASEAATLVKNAQDRIRHSSPHADTAPEVHLLRAYSATLRKNGNKKLANQVDEKATQIEQRLSGK